MGILLAWLKEVEEILEDPNVTGGERLFFVAQRRYIKREIRREGDVL